MRRYGHPFIMRMAVTVAAWPGICGLFGGEDGDFKCAAFVLGSSMSFLSSMGWLVGRGVGCWGGNSGRLEGVWRVKWRSLVGRIPGSHGVFGSGPGSGGQIGQAGIDLFVVIFVAG